jgi:hypothetical protein
MSFCVKSTQSARFGKRPLQWFAWGLRGKTTPTPLEPKGAARGEESLESFHPVSDDRPRRVQLVFRVDNMNAHVSGRESLNGAAEP